MLKARLRAHPDVALRHHPDLVAPPGLTWSALLGPGRNGGPRPPMRPFHFLADAHEIVPGRQLADKARHAEDLGYHALVIPDHLTGQLSPVVAMTAIAAATDTLRVGAFVLNNDLRHPAVLAQDLAAIDVLSEGRLDIAIGAGWNRPEYEAIGLDFDPTPVRQARLAEALTVIKGCLAGEPFSFVGEHYRITDYTGEASVQRPHPPVFIGGGGRRTLELAGREADIVGLAPRILRNGLDALSLTHRGDQGEDRMGASRPPGIGSTTSSSTCTRPAGRRCSPTTWRGKWRR